MYRLQLFSSANVSNANHELPSKRLEGVGLEHCFSVEEKRQSKPGDAEVYYALG
jgi:hypothetical protein